ncbi:hypothetical protein GNI_057450 [Gregarina niphandrodes]|uniref:Uncharacterized protein n=1 Tax=Gregarina niphandrodes TaxID=110365 RepID=A0A023B8M9_GRENI|nr:hypothetical protein GNI_057450 [Gregarina niphandrodes]EZG69600.1 hypothetical protein GNI_057450 [Gregarina niphandrodes]|eukprot:XP_011129994.1 hypothetical protein GNI_057450 [Gregarina niphandrodes]
MRSEGLSPQMAMPASYVLHQKKVSGHQRAYSKENRRFESYPHSALGLGGSALGDSEALYMADAQLPLGVVEYPEYGLPAHYYQPEPHGMHSRSRSQRGRPLLAQSPGARSIGHARMASGAGSISPFATLGVPTLPTVTVMTFCQDVFIERHGALQLLCVLNKVPLRLTVLKSTDDTRHIVDSLQMRPGGLLTPSYPVLQLGQRCYVLYLASARVLARHLGMYGVDLDGDYYADAIAERLQRWFDYQDRAVGNLKGLRSALRRKDRGERVAQDRKQLADYLSHRPYLYQVLAEMLGSWKHLYRPDCPSANWLDPLFATHLTDDLIIDLFLWPQHLTSWTRTQELIRSAQGIDSNPITSNLLDVGPINNSPTSLSQVIPYEHRLTVDALLNASYIKSHFTQLVTYFPDIGRFLASRILWVMRESSNTASSTPQPNSVAPTGPLTSSQLRPQPGAQTGAQAGAQAGVQAGVQSSDKLGAQTNENVGTQPASSTSSRETKLASAQSAEGWTGCVQDLRPETQAARKAPCLQQWPSDPALAQRQSY